MTADSKGELQGISWMHTSKGSTINHLGGVVRISNVRIRTSRIRIRIQTPRIRIQTNLNPPLKEGGFTKKFRILTNFDPSPPSDIKWTSPYTTLLCDLCSSRSFEDIPDTPCGHFNHMPDPSFIHLSHTQNKRRVVIALVSPISVHDSP